ncbi:MAG: SprB repeat-containing protein, partial [Flavobacteriales bacterium]|nr:SprB repeat-containing protein [Flavobacteriales bacterium]
MSVVIGQPAQVSMVSITPTPESCLGDADGTLTALAAGGTAPYTYNWSNGDTGPVLTATSGMYNVSVSDANGCGPATGYGEIVPTGRPNLADAGPDRVVCPSGGPVYLNETVENAPSGAWSGGDGVFNGVFPNVDYTLGPGDIAAGSVTLTLVTIGNNVCPQDTDQIVLTIPQSFIGIHTDQVDALCDGTATGSATVVTQATDFTYLWQPGGQTSQSVDGLAAGPYSVTVYDDFFCDTTLSLTIGEPDEITLAALNSTNETCGGAANGTLTAVVSGGTAPYIYDWSTGDDTPSITTGAGTYTVSVTDANGCAPASGSGTIAATGQPNQAFAGDDVVACQGQYPVPLSGTVVNATGGQWSGGSGTVLGSGLSIQYQPTPAEVLAGGVDLVLTTTGNTTCPPASDTVHIALSNSFLNAALNPTNALCNGDQNGTIAFAPLSDGLLYQWDDPAGQQ